MMKLKLFLIILITSITTFVNAGEGDKTRIAVLDFDVKSKNIDEEAGAVLADAFGYQLHQFQCYDVINRDYMKKILNEQGFQLSGVTTADDAEVLGQILDVQKLVTGSVGKLGNTFTLTIVLVDVATAREEHSEFKRVSGKIDAVLEIASNMSRYFCPEDHDGVPDEGPAGVETDFPLPDGFIAVKDSLIDSSTGLPSVIECLKDKSQMVLVPAGEFIMGSKSSKDERPVHKVYTDSYYIDKHEITVSQFTEFCKKTGHAMWTQPAWNKHNHPVVYVTYKDAVSYCKWAGKRLPTEAEWEKAARGPGGRAFPWGNTSVTGQKANFCDINCEKKWKESFSDDTYTHTSPVGSYENGKSPYGCYDMAGNVSEWCSDWYKKDYYKNSGMRNPYGPSRGKYRVHRGGSCYHRTDETRSAHRNFSLPLEIKPNRLVGFRGVLNP